MRPAIAGNYSWHRLGLSHMASVWRYSHAFLTMWEYCTIIPRGADRTNNVGNWHLFTIEFAE